eukprot:403331666
MTVQQSQSEVFLDEEIQHLCIILNVKELFTEEAWKSLDQIDVFLTSNWDESDKKPIQRSKQTFTENWKKALQNSGLIGSIELNSFHLKINDLYPDTLDENQKPSFEQNWVLLENLKTYALWAHPFVSTDDIMDEDKNDSERYIKWNNVTSDFQQIHQLFTSELNYLDKLLQSLIDDFKAQINSVISIQDMEQKELQRSFVYKNQKSNSQNNTTNLSSSDQIIRLRTYHREELDTLKQRQFAIISYIRTCMRGIQQTFDEIQQGKYDKYEVVKCQHCQRILKVQKYEENKNQLVSAKSTSDGQNQIQSRYSQKKNKKKQLKIKPEMYLKQQEDITKKILKIVKQSQDDKIENIVEDIHKSQQTVIDGSINNLKQRPIQEDQLEEQPLKTKKPIQSYLKKQNKKSSEDDLIDNILPKKPLISVIRNSDISHQHSKSILNVNGDSPGPYFDKIGAKSTKQRQNLNKSTLNKNQDESAMPNLQKLIHDLSKDRSSIGDQSSMIYKRNGVKERDQSSHRIRKGVQSSTRIKKKIEQTLQLNQTISLDQISEQIKLIEKKQNLNQQYPSENQSRINPLATKIPYNKDQNSQNLKTQQNYYSNASTNNTSKASDQNVYTKSTSQTTLNSENYQKRFSHSRDGYQQYQNHSNQTAQNIKTQVLNANSSKYTNIKEEKAKVSKLLEEFDRKQKLERELKLQSQLDSDMILKSNHNTSGYGGAERRQSKVYDTQTQEQQEYVSTLLKIKPWLACLPLKASKLEYLKKSFPIDDLSSVQVSNLNGKDLEDFKSECEYVSSEVIPKKNMLREKKSDYELLMDARYFNKYGDYLFKRLQSKSYYQRLEIGKDSVKSDIKKAYYKLALIWHPDNIRKKQKYGFAYEQIFTKLVAEIFVLFEEAYKTLSNEEQRTIYDKQIK